MFFMMGITDGRKQLDFTQTVICGVCGKYGRYQVFMTYTVLSLFFIPCFKWNRHLPGSGTVFLYAAFKPADVIHQVKDVLISVLLSHEASSG